MPVNVMVNVYATDDRIKLTSVTAIPNNVEIHVIISSLLIIHQRYKKRQDCSCLEIIIRDHLFHQWMSFAQF